jgi:hypothetical protein
MPGVGWFLRTLFLRLPWKIILKGVVG